MGVDGKPLYTHRSRGDVVWETLNHLHEALAYVGTDANDFIDGELYRHGVPLQRINSWVKKYHPKMTPTIQYMLYDLAKAEANFDHTWEDRWNELRRRYWRYVWYQIPAKVWPGKYDDWDFWADECEAVLWRDNPPMTWTPELVTWFQVNVPTLPLQLAETRVVESWHDVKTFEMQALAQGYEGLILRQHGRTYDFNGRPDSLVKVKQFIEADFKIVDAKSREIPSGLGRSLIVIDKFVVENDDDTGNTFETVPRGTMEQKKQMWLDWEAGEFEGHVATVAFPERSTDNIPQGNPVCRGVKMPDDQGGQTGGNTEDV